MGCHDPLYSPFRRSTLDHLSTTDLYPIPEVEEFEIATKALDEKQTKSTMAAATDEAPALTLLRFVVPDTPRTSVDLPSAPKASINLPVAPGMGSAQANNRWEEESQASNERSEPAPQPCQRDLSMGHEEYMSLIYGFKLESALENDNLRRQSMAAKKAAATKKEMGLKTDVCEREPAEKEGAVDLAEEESEKKREKRNAEGEAATKDGKLKRLGKWLLFWHRS